MMVETLGTSITLRTVFASFESVSLAKSAKMYFISICKTMFDAKQCKLC